MRLCALLILGDQDGVLAELPQVQEIKLPAEQSHQAGWF